MGLIGKLLSFTRTARHGANVSDSKLDPGGGSNITSEHFADPGDDSHPLPGDYVAALDVPRSGGRVAVGYIDPANDAKAAAGEKRMYSRDGNGAAVAEVWIKADGSVVISNALGDITLKADGGVEVDSPLALLEVKADGSIKGSNALGAFELKADGEYGSDNGAGNFKLLPSGIFSVNGVTISAAGTIIVPAGQSIATPSIVVDGKELDDHVHSGVTTGGSNTGPNV